jgi:predicted  nucleic acid-binding Zn-ribbon protein
MAQTLNIELLQLLEDKLGKEEGRKVAEAIEIGLGLIEKKAEAVALQKKLELRDELTKELASKADLLAVEARLEGKIEVVRQEMQTIRQEMQTIKTELDRKFTIMFIILFFTVIFLNQNALEFIFRVLGVIK